MGKSLFRVGPQSHFLRVKICVASILLGSLFFVCLSRFSTPVFANQNSKLFLELIEELHRPAGKAARSRSEFQGLLKFLGARHTEELAQILSRSESTLSQSLLRTQRGMQLYEQIGPERFHRFVSRLSQELERTGEELSQRLRETTEAALPSGSVLTRSDRLFLESATREILADIHRITQGDWIRISRRFRRLSSEARSPAEELLKAGGGKKPSSAAKGAKAPEAIETAKAQEFGKGFFKDLNSCLQSQKVTDNQSNFFRFLFSEMGLTAAFTAGGYVAAKGFKETDFDELSFESASEILQSGGTLVQTGVENISWPALATDLLSGATSSAMATFVAGWGGHTTWKKRWIRYQLFGMGSTVMDAGVYYVAKGSDAQKAFDRGSYNAIYSAASAPRKAAIYQLVTGMMCLYRNPASPYSALKLFAAGNTIRIVDKIGFTLIYFALRNEALGKDG